MVCPGGDVVRFESTVESVSLVGYVGHVDHGRMVRVGFRRSQGPRPLVPLVEDFDMFSETILAWILQQGTEESQRTASIEVLLVVEEGYGQPVERSAGSSQSGQVGGAPSLEPVHVLAALVVVESTALVQVLVIRQIVSRHGLFGLQCAQNWAMTRLQRDVGEGHETEHHWGVVVVHLGIG